MNLPDLDFFRSTFDHMLEGVQILDQNWRYRYLNLAAEVQNRRPNAELLGNVYADMWPGISETYVYQVISDCLVKRFPKSIENRFVYPDGRVGWFELSIQPVPEGVLILSFDITNRKLAEQQLSQMKRLYATLSEVNQAIVRLREPLELYRKICEVAGQFGGFALSWIGILEESGDIRPVAALGLDPDRWPVPVINIHRGPSEDGPSATAIRTGKVVVRDDIHTDPKARAFLANLGDYPYLSTASVPLNLNGRPVGVLNLLSSEMGFFQSAEEVRLLAEIGLDISFALETMETEKLRRQWADAFEYCAHGIVIGTVAGGTILTCNPAFARDQRSTPAALQGRKILSLYRPEDQDRVLGFVSLAQRTGLSSFEATKVRDDGTLYEVSMDIVCVRNDQGNLLYQVATQMDISSRKETERRLRESENRRSAIFDRSPVGIIMTRLNDGKIVDVNGAFARIHGYDPGEMIGRTSFDLRLWADEGARSAMVQSLKAGDPYGDKEIRFRKKNGEIGILRVSSELVVIDGEGYSLGTAQDITTQKLLEAQLVQAQKLESLGTLSSGIAHDFNNLLAVILGQTALLEKTVGDPGSVALRTKTIAKASRRGADLVKQLLTFARKTDVEFRAVDLNEVVSDTVELLSATFPKTINLQVDPSPGLPAVEADPSLVHQILLNLCINARDAMDSKGSLILRTFGDRDEAGVPWVVLEVSDTGTGMDDATARRIFEPFFTTKERGKGTGLGLSMVFGTMVSHHGTVTFRSAPGQGTSFFCRFPVPLGAVGPEPSEPDLVAGGPGGGETVLVVEDEAALRDTVKELLESKGYRVLTAPDGKTGLEFFRVHREAIALVVSDLGLPTLGGDDLYRGIAAINPRVPLVLTSGYFAPGMKARLRAEGLTEFLQKPYEGDDLLRAVRRSLDTPRP